MPYGVPTECTGCGAAVVWLRTRNDSKQIVDIETWHGEITYDHTKHRSHWATCPRADEFRKRKAATDQAPPLTKNEQEDRGQT